VRLLVDSNAFIWAYARPSELSMPARQALGDADNERFISLASLWEIAIKQSTGKLELTNDIASAIDDLALAPLAITLPHVARTRSLPFHHRDPFDRMLVAQAMEEGLTIVTRDRRLEAYGVPVLAA
jgi:PIN domain nuclease of toxin-antitoxin system